MGLFVVVFFSANCQGKISHFHFLECNERVFMVLVPVLVMYINYPGPFLAQMVISDAQSLMWCEISCTETLHHLTLLYSHLTLPSGRIWH